MPHQKDTISYLAAGVEEEFSVKEVVFYWGMDKPESVPDKLEIVIFIFVIDEERDYSPVIQELR